MHTVGICRITLKHREQCPHKKRVCCFFCVRKFSCLSYCEGDSGGDITCDDFVEVKPLKNKTGRKLK